MKTTKRLSLLCMAVVFGCFWAACESELDGGPEGVVPKGKGAVSLTRSDSVQVALMNVIQGLCKTDSTLVDKLEMNTGAFEPNYGVAVYSVTPTVRYQLVSDADYARTMFMNKFRVAILYSRADTTGTDIRINLDAYGSIEYSSMQSGGSVAVINVDVPQIPDLTQVVYIRPEAMSQNGGEGQLKEGDVLRYKDGRYWICIQPSTYGGLLATFDRRDGHPFNGNDGGYDPKPTFVDDPFVAWCRGSSWYPKGINNNSHINLGFPSCEELEVLRRFMFNDDGTREQIAEDVFTFAIKNRGGENLYNNMFDNGRIYCCGDGAGSWIGPVRTYTYSKYCTKYMFRKDGWYDFKYDFNTRSCRTSWYVMQANTYTFLNEPEWETYNLYGSYPQRCISETMNFIRTEMKTFKDDDIFYDPDTFEGRNGWELVYPI